MSIRLQTRLPEKPAHVLLRPLKTERGLPAAPGENSPTLECFPCGASITNGDRSLTSRCQYDVGQAGRCTLTDLLWGKVLRHHGPRV